MNFPPPDFEEKTKNVAKRARWITTVSHQVYLEYEAFERIARTPEREAGPRVVLQPSQCVS